MGKTFLCSYRYAGSEWNLEIYADDWVDAEKRLLAIQRNVTLDGEARIEIHAYPGAGILARTWVWLINAFRKEA